MKPAAHCAVPGSKKVERRSLPRGRIEKMVPTEMLFSRLAEPSSGSIATQSGASGSRSPAAPLLGKNRRDRGTSQRAPHHLVGGDVDVLLLIAVGIDAAVRVR